MRRFMSTKRSLADARIAYTLFFAVCAALAGSMAISNGTSRILDTLLVNRSLGALTECADSLEALRRLEAEVTAPPERRLSEILRFELAVESLGLPDGTALALRKTAVGLRAGESVKPELAELFARLAAMSATDTADIAGALDALLTTDTQRVTPSASARSAGSVNDRFVMICAKRNLEALLPGVSGSLKLGRESEYIGVSTRNLRVRFSDFDGSPSELVYIHLGTHEGGYFTEDELCERARGFISAGSGGDIECRQSGRSGGFRLYEYEVEEERGRLILDSSGRLWALHRER